jgi:hypothetical protein
VRGLGLVPERVHDLRDGSSLVLEDGEVRLVEGERAAEPLAAWGAVSFDAAPTVSARARMRAAGVLVVHVANDAVALAPRGVFPPIDDDVGAELRQAARESAALRAQGADDGDALRPLIQCFKRRDRMAPELVLLT